MPKREIIIIADYTETSSLSLDELCEACQISYEEIQALVEYDIIQPEGESPDAWLFDLEQLQRVKTAIRLQHELEVNHQGVAIILDLLDEVEALEDKIHLLEKHLLR